MNQDTPEPQLWLQTTIRVRTADLKQHPEYFTYTVTTLDGIMPYTPWHGSCSTCQRPAVLLLTLTPAGMEASSFPWYTTGAEERVGK